MPFKLSYSFEGNYRTRPEQNLSGASRKHSRDVLLQRAHDERQKRQEQRLKLRSTEILQSYFRSYLVRKKKKNEERELFDEMEGSANLDILLRRFLFFYNADTDRNRKIRLCERLVHQQEMVLKEVAVNTSFAWQIKRLLVHCLPSIFDFECSVLMLQCLNIFTNNRKILQYLLMKGYFVHLSKYFNSIPENDVQMECVLSLIDRPFQLMSHGLKDVVLWEFCNNFMCPTITSNIKNVLIPYLRGTGRFPYEDLVQYLYEHRSFDSTNSLFYCLLALEPDDFETTGCSLQVLASLTANIYNIKPELIPVSEDSDDEEMYMSSEQQLTEDYIHLINSTNRIKKILLFFDKNSHDEEILAALMRLSHNLLLAYKDSIRKYMLLYMLALKSTFLNALWSYIKKYEANVVHTSGSCACFTRDSHKAISVFCDMFSFYTETLTDSESTDTSGTFTSSDLFNMSELLKSLALHLIDLAFPMCRSNMIRATPEVVRYYTACLNSIKVLYMLDMRKKFCPQGFWTKNKIPISPDLPRKNYLSKTIKPFYGLVNEDEDERLPPLSTIEQRSLAILQQLPFLIEFNTRVLLLRELCRHSLTDADGYSISGEFMSDNTVVIRRTHLYEDAFEKLSLENESDLRKKIRIQFINSVGLEEAGIDGGGIFKEFISEVLKTALDPNRGFFLLAADNALYPNPNVHLIEEHFTNHYFFIGRLVGKAIFENILVDLPLAEFFLAKLLVDRASAHYLKSLDPVLYRNLLYLRDYKGDVQDLGLDFTNVTSDLGETKIVDLKPDGHNIAVTNDNRLEYIHRLADMKLNVQIKKQCAAFRDGLDSVVPLLWLKLFNYQELQVIIGGNTQAIDLTDLQAHTVYGGEFTADHPTIILFWKIVQTFTDSQKKQLLKFVTSCSRAPLLGFKELTPLFCIHSSGSEDRMPTASTCLNLLKIPVIHHEKVLRDKLLSAIAQQAGFELS